MEKNNYLVIMAGGVGSRFWPYSRNDRPKQFLDVMGTGKSLLQLTYERFAPLVADENVYIVTNASYEEQIREQLPMLGPDQVLLEPSRRNTAPCVAYAAYKIRQKNPEARMIVAPSDHLILQEEQFRELMSRALQSAQHDKLLTVGIRPTRPETGYGYIQYVPDGSTHVKKVKTFTEKPQLELAKTFLATGEFVWNSGMFIWHVQAIIDAFEQHLPDMAELFDSEVYYSEAESGLVEDAYSKTKNISIDFGVMEKAPNVFVLLGDFGWTDLGSWASLHEVLDKDQNQNVIEAKALTYNSRDNLIKAPADKVVVIQDLEGYLVADTENVLIVCKKDAESQFRNFVRDVKNEYGEDFI